MQHLNYDELVKNHLFNYKDSNIGFIDDISRLDLTHYEGCTLSFAMGVFCTRGRFQVMLDDAELKMEEGDMTVYMPGKRISKILKSQDAEVSLLPFSRNAIDHSLYLQKFSWSKLDRFNNNMVLRLNQEEQETLKHYFVLISQKRESNDKSFRKDVAGMLFQALMLETLMIIDRKMAESDIVEELSEVDSSVRQSTIIYRKFCRLLTESDGKIRQVAHFAMLMGISPKYLSKCVKEECGIPPTELVRQTVVKNIERQLRFSNKTIKEICVEYNFPNLSFFGKFVKEQLGMSPTEYRKQSITSAEQ